MIIIFWAIQVARYTLLLRGVKDSKDLSTSNDTSTRTKVTDLIHLTSYFTQCFEYILLLYGIYLYYTSKVGESLQIISTIREACKYNNHLCKNILIAAMAVVLILLYVPLLRVIVEFTRPEHYFDFYRLNFEYAAPLAAMDYLFNFLVQIAMAVVTVVVISAWKKAEKEINEENNAVKTLLDHLVEKYHSIGNKVNTVQKLFQGWFAIKWLVHFINITGYSLLAAGTMLSGNRDKDEYEEYQFNKYVPISLVYDVFGFSFLFVCGSLMNHYHTNYRKKQAILLRERLSESNDEYALIMRTSDSIIGEVREYRFLPTILWIDLPLLNSPSYILIMLLAVVGFTANFLLV